MWKIMISPGVFFFHFLKKKWPKLTKNYVRLTPYRRSRTSYDRDFWCIYVLQPGGCLTLQAPTLQNGQTHSNNFILWGWRLEG